MNSIPSAITATFSISYDIPVLKVCSILVILKELKEVLTVDISRDQAIVLIALWKKCDKDHQISVHDGFNTVNALYHDLDEPEINKTIYNRTLDQLTSLHCIEIISDIICLREKIIINYH